MHRQYLRNFAAQPSKLRRMGERRTILGLRANGGEFPADAAISKLDVGGARLFTIVARDISEQKRAEADQQLLLEVGTVLASTFDYEETLDKLAALVVNAVSDCCIVDLVEEDGQLRRVKVAHRDARKAGIVRTLKCVPVDPRRRIASDALYAQAPILVSAVTPDYLATISQGEDQLIRPRLQPGSFARPIG